VLDVLLDFSGVLAAVLLARLIRNRKEKKRREA
jgi:hypothetical protein